MAGDTKTRILRSAVDHFGRLGFDRASLRAILAEAQINSSAANYHFGSKAGLYKAVIERYVDRTLDHRYALLEQAEAVPLGPGRARALVEAYIRPHIELVVGEKEWGYGRLLLRISAESLDSQSQLAELRAIDEKTLPVRLRFRDGLRVCFPEADSDRLSRAIGFVFSVMQHAPFNLVYFTLTEKVPLDQPVEAVIESAAEFAYGGLVRLLDPARRP